MRPNCPHPMTRLSHSCSLDLRLLPKELVANELFFLADGGSEVVLGSTVPGSKNPIDALVSPPKWTNMGQLYVCVYMLGRSPPHQGFILCIAEMAGCCEYYDPITPSPANGEESPRCERWGRVCVERWCAPHRSLSLVVHRVVILGETFLAFQNAWSWWKGQMEWVKNSLAGLFWLGAFRSVCIECFCTVTKQEHTSLKR